jgi:enterochelin esterase family protein
LNEFAHTLRSAHLGNERTVWVRPPRTGEKPVYLTIFLDAELYRDRVGAVATIEALQAASAIAPTWFVFVSSATEEARWRECPCYPPFARFIADELLPWLEATYPAVKRCRERVLVGLSYTGLAAAFVALEAVGKFGKVIAQSGSFWSDDCRLVEQYRKRGIRLPTSFYLDVGSKETDVDVQHKEDVRQVVSQIDAVRRFRDVLVKQRHDVKYLEFEGGHDCAAWQKTLPDALRWALPAAAPPFTAR